MVTPYATRMSELFKIGLLSSELLNIASYYTIFSRDNIATLVAIIGD